jgi:uncharacterized protein DUF4402
VSTTRHRRNSGGSLLLALAAAGASASSSAQTINTVSGLSFGSFVAGGGGTITISPGGGRTSFGGVVALGQSTTYGGASFRVSGTAGAGYTITLPGNDVVFLTDGVHTMALNNFISNPSMRGLLSGGSQLISVGATLNVGSSQPPGNYAGTFSVTVNY